MSFLQPADAQNAPDNATIVEPPGALPRTVWGWYWRLAKAFDRELEKDWNSDLDVLLIVVRSYYSLEST